MAMPGPVKTEAVVLRSMRYGEADRILQLYTPGRGRVSAIAKGVRRARSRFGGRLEPFFRLKIELHEGRGELLTVTGAQTVHGHPSLRGDARALDAAARACDAVGRLFETSEPHPGVFNLLCRKLLLLDENPAGATRASALARVAPAGFSSSSNSLRQSRLNTPGCGSEVSNRRPTASHARAAASSARASPRKLGWPWTVCAPVTVSSSPRPSCS